MLMASGANLSNRSLKKIAERLGPYLAIKAAGSEKGRWQFAYETCTPTLGVGLQIWVLGFNTMKSLRSRNALALGNHRVAELAENSGYWHLEIKKDDGRAVGFAEAFEAVALDKHEWRVHRMGLLPIAARQMERALARLQEVSATTTSMPRVRVLKVPSTNLGLLWLEDRKVDKIVVFHKPRGTRRLSTRRQYEWVEFVGILSRRLASLSSNGPKLTPHPSTSIPPN
jgi:hypothetical protein